MAITLTPFELSRWNGDDLGSLLHRAALRHVQWPVFQRLRPEWDLPTTPIRGGCDPVLIVNPPFELQHLRRDEPLEDR